jgi:hypothetical protein
MKIGDKKIRPIANPVPFPKALANYTLYMMLMITAMIRSRETIARIIVLLPSGVARPLTQEATILK